MKSEQVKPEAGRSTFADNQVVTVATAIRHFAAYDGNRRPIDIATAYFNIGGFSTIADVLEAAPSVRILLGAEPRPLTSPDTLSADQADVVRSLDVVSETLRAERDALPFEPTIDAEVRRLLAFLTRPTTEVRIYRKRFLHGKAFIFGSEAAVIAGSANFTAAGLQHNLELDLGQYDPDKVTPVADWFESLWNEADQFDLVSLFISRVEEYDPYRIYMRILVALYGDEIALDDHGLDQRRALQLAEFQQLGSRRAMRILDEWGGAMLADGVGLGKTFIAGDILRQFAIDRGLYVLILCPAALREMWQDFLLRQQVPGKVISYTKLAREHQLTGGDGHELSLPPSSYHLIVADEAHALRNPDTLHYRAVQRLLTLAQNAKLLMLTATPVNNSLWDLYYEIMLFAKGDGRFSRIGIPSLRDHFRVAGRTALDELNPAHLFPVLDAIAVRRTRTFVREHFPNAVVQTPSGPLRIVFPDVHLEPVRYDFDALKPGLFPRVADAIEARLTMARYRTGFYAAPPRDVARQEFLAGLLRSQMLKRFESSAAAFLLTLTRMLEAYERTIALVDTGVVPTINLDAEEDLFDEVVLNRLADEGSLEPAAGYDVQRLKGDLLADISILRELQSELADVKPQQDPKLCELRAILVAAASAEAPRRKTLVFTTYSDTADYIKQYLEHEIQNDPQLSVFQGRIAYVVGSATDADERSRLAAEFAPRSMLPDNDGAPDRYDLLVTTDVLAEGQNLQQCGRLVNFDLPWNPMRIVQRNGRIDRIGSPHSYVDVYCMMPDEELEVVLRLEERLQKKIAQASASIGVEGEIIPGSSRAERVFIDAEENIKRLARGDASVIDDLEREDAYSGEVFREELRQLLVAETKESLEALPWGIGSGFQNPSTKATVFLAKAGGRYLLRKVPLVEGEVQVEDDLLRCVLTARCAFGTTRYLPGDLQLAVYRAWEKARSHIARWFADQRDPQLRQAAVPRVQREAVDLLQRADMASAWEAAEALSSPWPIDVQRRLRAIMGNLVLADKDRVAHLISYVRERGLKAIPIPDIPNVLQDDVHLVCFQMVTN